MPITSINVPRGTQQKDTLDKIAQAIGIAENILGTAIAIPKILEDRRQGRAALEEQRRRTDIDELQTFRPAQKIDSGGTTQLPSGAAVQDISRPAQYEEGSAILPGSRIFKGPVAPRAGKSDLSQMLDSLKITSLLKDFEPLGPDQISGLQRAFPDIPPSLLPTKVGEARDLVQSKARAQVITVSPQEEKKFAFEQTKEQRRLDEDERGRYIKELDQVAPTKKDADDIKNGLANKKAIAKLLDSMIELRTKHPNGTVTDREDVARGKQLSTRALLKFKSLEQLGVLSKTDLELIDRLVPGDPLQITPAQLAGQDPTMAQLRQLRENLDDDLNIFIEARGLTPMTEPGTTPSTLDRIQAIKKKRGLK